jgi:hypothetical protein
LPTRVIDIGLNNDSLFLFTSFGKSARYAALSHCWGGNKIMTTTKATLKNREERLEFSKLPRTFQHAVDITRQIGLQYLWIDSLCIVQDSSEWDIEASKMAQIYANSCVTIAADGAEDGDGGCFVTGDRRNGVFTIPFTNLDGCMDTVCFLNLRSVRVDNTNAHRQAMKDLSPSAAD